MKDNTYNFIADEINERNTENSGTPCYRFNTGGPLAELIDAEGRGTSVMVDVVDCPGSCANWETCVTSVEICDQYRPIEKQWWMLALYIFALIMFFSTIICCYREHCT